MKPALEKPFLSIIIPAYNEEKRIIPGLETAVRYLQNQPYIWEMLVVDDGSTDRTSEIVSRWTADHDEATLVTIPHAGKGWAIRYGMLASTGEYRFMCDADMAMPIEYLEQFLDNMAKGYDIVIGSRQIEGARRFDESFMRHAMGRVFNSVVSLIATRGFHDTQCGFKCFKAEAAEQLFSQQKTKGFGFDVEILYLAQKQGMQILEMPIDWYHRSISKVRPGIDSLLMVRDILQVRANDFRNQYNMAATAQATLPYTAARKRTVNGFESAHYISSSDPKNIEGQVAIVIPTYNEAGNLPALAERLFALGIPNMKIIIIDDNSPDGTAEIAKELNHKFDQRLELIERDSKQGLGTAYVRGFRQALDGGADYVLQMDADLSHEPEYIPDFIEALKEADVVVGSRYTTGGGIDEKWSIKRRLLSSMGNIGIRMASGLKVKDSTTGFKAFRASTLRSLKMSDFRCKGFGFQAEVAYACQQQGHKVVEYPITFYDRSKGQSKMSINIMLEAIWRLTLLRWNHQN